LVNLGTIKGMTNDLVASERYLKELIGIEPGNSEGLAGLGNLELLRGRVYQAIVYYEKAIAARPGNREAAINLATAYERIGQPERAESIRRATH